MKGSVAGILFCASNQSKSNVLVSLFWTDIGRFGWSTNLNSIKPDGSYKLTVNHIYETLQKISVDVPEWWTEIPLLFYSPV